MDDRGQVKDSLLEDDRKLLQVVAQGDRDAFQKLYHRYYAKLSRFVFRITQRSDLVEEIVNDAMVVVWEKAASYNGTSKVSTWIFGIAYLKAIKSLQRWSRVNAPLDTDALQLDSLPDPDQQIPNIQLARDLQLMLTQLPAEQRAVIELTFYYGYSYQEISAIVGCPVNTVKTRMFHARRKLRKLLPDGIECPES
ncbi:MAG: RNA polymerase sigma factor [Gammaproteobacteria bacterium]|nr:RNA polymerase sigma factor [Gammaproteobacteria bacterium]